MSATAAYWLSHDSWEDGDPYAGIDAEISDTVYNFARLLADVIWVPPAIRSLRYKRRFKRLMKAREELSSESYQNKIRSARRRVV